MSNTMPGNFRKTWKYHDVDKGFAWIVLIGCFTMYMFVVGSFKAYGVLYTEMVEYYSSGSGNTAWIGTISLILQFSLGPIANLLCKTYTFRRVTMVGGVLLGLGYFLSGFVTRMEYIYLTFLSTGIGYGLTFAPCSTIISYYFDKRRALANGIVVSGSGVGAIALPFLYKYIIELYGLKGAFWILGAILSNVCVAACVFRQPMYLVEEQEEKVRTKRIISNEYNADLDRSSSGTSVERSVQKIVKKPCEALDLRFYLFKKALFALYVTSFMCSAFGFAANLIVIPASVKALGYDKTYVALSVTIFGGVEVVARILIGWFADLKLIKRTYIFAICMLIGGAISLLAPLFESFSFIAVYATITAAFPGTFPSLMPVLIMDAVGLENFSSAFGLLSLSLAVAITPSQPSVGWLYDFTGTWNSSFILIGCMYFLAGVIVLLEPIVVRCCINPANKETDAPINLQQSNHQDRSTISACTDDVGSSETSFTS